MTDSPRPALAPLALSTLRYSLLLAAIMQAAHFAVRLAFGAMLNLASLPGLVTLLAELAQKITWSTLICEALVFASILARRRWRVPTPTRFSSAWVPWLLLVLVSFLATLLAVWAADLLAALIVLPHPLTNINTLDVGAGLNEGLFRGGKYLFLGAALAWVNRLAEPALRHYALAGGASSLIAVVLTYVVRAGDAPVVLGGQLAVEVLFPLGCALVVWKVRQLAAPLLQTQQGYRAQMRRI